MTFKQPFRHPRKNLSSYTGMLAAKTVSPEMKKGLTTGAVNRHHDCSIGLIAQTLLEYNAVPLIRLVETRLEFANELFCLPRVNQNTVAIPFDLPGFGKPVEYMATKGFPDL